MRTALGLVVFFACLPTGLVHGAEAGENWIDNGAVRVAVDILPVARRWTWRCEWRNAAGERIGTIEGTLLGRGDQELNQRYLGRWGVYYLFEKTIPVSVHTSVEKRGPRMDLRVQREDVWMEFSILLPGDGPFVVFECIGRSHASLQGHTRQNLPAPMLYLTGEGGTTAARDRRESHTYDKLVRYLFAWRPDHENVYGLLSMSSEQRPRAQWPPGGYRSVYVDMPYMLWCARQPAPREPGRLQDYGEALWLQALWQLPGRFAQPEDAEP